MKKVKRFGPAAVSFANDLDRSHVGGACSSRGVSLRRDCRQPIGDLDKILGLADARVERVLVVAARVLEWFGPGFASDCRVECQAIAQAPPTS